VFDAHALGEILLPPQWHREGVLLKLDYGEETRKDWFIPSMPRRRNSTRRINWWLKTSLVERIEAMAAEEGYATCPGRYMNEILLPGAIEHWRMERQPTAEELAQRVYRAPGWR